MPAQLAEPIHINSRHQYDTPRNFGRVVTIPIDFNTLPTANRNHDTRHTSGTVELRMSVHMLEAQKAREAGWVAQGVQRFTENLERAAKTGEAAMSPGGAAVMREAVGRLEAHLDAHAVKVGATRYPMADPIVPVVLILGSRHLAAVVVHRALAMTWAGVKPKDISGDFMAKAGRLGGDLEHDVRFRAWEKTEEPARVRRMKLLMKGEPRTWKKRSADLEIVGAEEWDHQRRVEVGIAMISALVEACPDIFKLGSVRQGVRTYHALRLTQVASEALENLTAIAAVATPARGMMIVPPLDWVYREAPGV